MNESRSDIRDANRVENFSSLTSVCLRNDTEDGACVRGCSLVS
jgi:hypothetical protein